MVKQVSSFNAKTHLSNLLVQVENGQEFIITRDNHAIAKLVPIKQFNNDRKLSNVIKEMEEMKKSFTLNFTDGINKLKQEGRK